MGVDELKGYLEEIKDSIRNKTYKPELVRRVEIPIYESIFSDNSFGFRPNRCCEMAIIKALEYMN